MVAVDSMGFTEGTVAPEQKKVVIDLASQLFNGSKELNEAPLRNGTPNVVGEINTSDLLRLSHDIVHFLNFEPALNPKAVRDPGNERAHPYIVPNKPEQFAEILIQLCRGDSKKAIEFLGTNTQFSN